MIVEFADGITHAGTRQFKSATARFNFRDRGRAIADLDGTVIDANTYIKEVFAPDTILLSKDPVSVATNVKFIFHRFRRTVVLTDVQLVNGVVIATSGTAIFTPEDVGQPCSGTHIPDGTDVVSVGDGTIVLSNEPDATATISLTIDRAHPLLLWEFDRLGDRAREILADARRDYDREHVMSQDSVNEFITRLCELAEDFDVENVPVTNKPILNVNMKNAPAPSGGAVTMHATLTSLGHATSGDNY